MGKVSVSRERLWRLVEEPNVYSAIWGECLSGGSNIGWILYGFSTCDVCKRGTVQL